MTHPEIIDLLGAYALDAVEADEEQSITAHLSDCVRCRQEVDGFREIAALLAGPGVGQPMGGWDRLAKRVEDPIAPAPARTPRWLAPVLSIAAAMVVGLGLYSIAIHEDLALMTERAAAAEADLVAELSTPVGVDAVLTATMQDVGSTFVNLDASDATEVLIVLSDDGTGYLARHNLPALTDGSTYQLWAVVNDHVISAGVLGADPPVVPFRIDPDGLQGFAITIEEAGGVAVSEAEPVAAWFKDA